MKFDLISFLFESPSHPIRVTAPFNKGALFKTSPEGKACVRADDIRPYDQPSNRFLFIV